MGRGATVEAEFITPASRALGGAGLVLSPAARNSSSTAFWSWWVSSWTKQDDFEEGYNEERRDSRTLVCKAKRTLSVGPGIYTHPAKMFRSGIRLSSRNWSNAVRDEAESLCIHPGFANFLDSKIAAPIAYHGWDTKTLCLVGQNLPFCAHLNSSMSQGDQSVFSSGLGYSVVILFMQVMSDLSRLSIYHWQRSCLFNST